MFGVGYHTPQGYSRARTASEGSLSSIVTGSWSIKADYRQHPATCIYVSLGTDGPVCLVTQAMI